MSVVGVFVVFVIVRRGRSADTARIGSVGRHGGTSTAATDFRVTFLQNRSRCVERRHCHILAVRAAGGDVVAVIFKATATQLPSTVALLTPDDVKLM